MKNANDSTLHELATSGIFRVTPTGRIETCRKWNGHADVTVPWYVCDRADGKGYRYVSYHMVRVKAHRLAYLLHHPGSSIEGWEINHLDGCRTNNRKKNLERCDAARQSRHAYELGLNKARGVGHRLAKLDDAKVREMRALRELGVTYVKLGQRFDITPAAARFACTRHTWKHVS